ncbi:DNA cytosine methyltransferase [Chromobacterium violaceum]|uniref:DNA cytosine methyltransferase n=1 Tax=Chromobacterium violaceum TaxID=536 RepID=UPI0035A59B29
MKYKTISLFSGAMGLDIGMHMTDRFELLAAVEKIPAFCETIRHNVTSLGSNTRVFEGDISNIDPLEVMRTIGIRPGELDVLVGGPPCQSFSTAGKRGTTQDPRGTLLWQFLRFVEVMRPKIFVMENVRGLISAALRHRPISERKLRPLEPDEEPGSVVQMFVRDLQAMEGASYHLDVFEVNSVNYGAPQIRERVLFIGNRYNAQIDFPEPTHGNPVDTESRSESIQRSLLDEPLARLQPWRTLGDALKDLKEDKPSVLDFSERKKTFLSLIPPGSNWRSLPIELQQESMGKAWFAKGGRSGWWRRLTMDLPCPTLMTLPNHASTSLCHPTETRALSVREYARVQEFPDSWVFKGTLAEQYTQIGNAVPTRLGLVAGQVVADALDLLKSRDWQPIQEAREGYRLVYLQSHVRTRKWFKDGKTIVWGEDDNSHYAEPKTKSRVRTLRATVKNLEE